MGIYLGTLLKVISPIARLLVFIPMCGVWSVGLVATPALARVVDLERVFSFSIKSQQIDSALLEFSKQTDIQIVVAPDVDGTAEAPPVNGPLSARVALDTLLKHTGLHYAAIDTSISIMRRRSDMLSKPDSSESVSAVAEDLGSAQRDNLAVNTSVANDMTTAKNVDAKEPKEPVEIVIRGKYEFLSADTSGTTNLPLPIEKVPQSISLVSSDFIQAADLKTLAAIAEYTPGATNAGNVDGTQTLIALRGFSASRAVDGVPVGNGLYEPDYAIYDRLEVVKGPSSVVYGVATPGGLVNSVTKSATAQTPSYLSAQFGSWHNYRIEAQGAGALDSDGQARAIGLVVRDQGDSFLNYVFHKKTVVYGGLNVNLGTAVTGYIHGGYEKFERTTFDGNLAEPDGSPAPIARSFCMCSESLAATNEVYHAEGGLSWHPEEMLELGIKSNFERSSLYGPNGYACCLSDGSAGPAGSILMLVGVIPKGATLDTSYGIGVSALYRLDDVGMKKSFLSLEALYNNELGKNAGSFAVGSANIFDGQQSVRQAFDATLSEPMFPGFSATRASTLTVSTQAVLQIIDPVSMLLGASYSRPDISVRSSGPSQVFSYPSQMSYRAGVTYEVLPGINAYISFSQSYQPQKLLNTNHAPIAPLTGNQYEAGVKYRSAGGGLLLTAAAFQITETNLANYSFSDPATGLDYYTSIGKVRNRGFELSALGHLTSRWQVNGGYAYLDPKIVQNPDPSQAALSGQTQLYRSKNTFSLYTTYGFDSGMLRGLTFGTGVRYVSNVRTSYDNALANMQAQLTPTKDIPGYAVLDGFASYAFDKWIVQLNVKNILNKYYFTNTYKTLYYGNIPSDPINFALSIRRTF